MPAEKHGLIGPITAGVTRIANELNHYRDGSAHGIKCVAGDQCPAHLFELVAAVVAVGEGAQGRSCAGFQGVGACRGAGGACCGHYGLLDAPPACVQLPRGSALGGGVAGEAVLCVVGPAFHACAAVPCVGVGASWQARTEAGAAVGCAQ